MTVYKHSAAKNVTTHGVARSCFKDWATNESSFDRALVEESLGHSLSAVEKAYRRGQAVERRRVLMTAWAAYLDGETTVIDLATRRVG